MKKYHMVLNKFTSGYFNRELNFCIENLPKNNIKNIPYSILLTEKTLLRGMPTNLSSYLKHKLNEHYTSEEINFDDEPYLISDTEQIWTEKTILGNKKNNDVPALTFFQNISEDLGEYSFIKNLIIPEYEIAEFLPGIIKNEELISRTKVDFFSPHGGLVIEIDGKQHDDTIKSDKARDKALKEYKIETIRIKTESIRIRDEEYFKKIDLIKERLSLSETVKRYKQHFEKKSYKKENFSFTSIAINRFQILVIEMIKKGILGLSDKEWKLSINSDFICGFNWAEIAIQDIFEWLLPISTLYEEKVTLPELKINFGDVNENTPQNYLPIDFKLFERVDEKQSSKITVKSYYIDKIMLDKKTFDYFDFNDLTALETNNKVIKDISDKKKEALHKILYQIYGYTKFKEGQLPIIEKIFEQDNTLGLLPTGGGKSLCFQLPSILKMGFCVVVCPIKALMNDHVDELEQYGFKNRSVFINNEQSPEERELIYQRIEREEVHFIFVSPERFQNAQFRNVIKNLDNKNLISYLVIDEVHCLSEWGHDFRTSYLALANTIVSILKLNVPIISLTATASPNVLNNIIIELNIKKENVVYRMHLSRPELTYEVQKTKNKNENLLKNITEMKNTGYLSKEQAGIIFTMHVENYMGCIEVEQNIQKFNKDISTGIFSGKAPKKWNSYQNEEQFNLYKRETQQKFKSNEIQLMCATKSFGMGINKPNIRFSIHYGMPASMESLYQETGRTGRDGEKAKNIILFTDEIEEVPSKIHNVETSLSELEKYVEQDRFKNRGDFKHQISLMTFNKQSIDEELEGTLSLLELLVKKNSNSTQLITKHEVNLYRLLQIGIVKDWLVINSFTNVYEVNYNLITDEEIADNVFKQIVKYLPSEAENNNHKKQLNRIIASDLENKKEQLIRYLLKWNNDNFLYMRRQSLKTLYDYTKEFEITGAEEFKQKVEAYFKVNEQSIIIEQYIETDYEFAPPYLKEILIKDNKLISNDQVKELIFILARFLESYQNNPWLNLLSSMCRLITKSFDNPDGKVRLYNFITEAKKSSHNWSVTLENLLDFAKVLNDEDKLVLSKVLEPHLENDEELIMLHKYLQDDYSAIRYLDKFNKRLEKVY